MSRKLTNTLAATAAVGLAASAFGQVSYSQPVLVDGGNFEFISADSAVRLDILGADYMNADAIDVTFQTILLGDGGTVTPAGAAVTIANADNAFDTGNDGTFGDAVTDTGDQTFTVSIPLAIVADADLGTRIDDALGTVGSLFLGETIVAAGLRITIQDQNGAMISTTDPTSFDAANGRFNAAATTPVLLDATNDLAGAFLDTSGMNTQLLLQFERPLTNGSGDNALNNADVTAIDENDLDVDTANTFPNTPDNPTALTGNPAIGGTNNDVLTFTFDGTVGSPDIPAVAEFVRALGGDITDFAGRPASADTDGTVIQALVEFAVQSVAWRQRVTPNGANSADALAVTFTLPVDPTDPGDADFYQMIFMGETLGAGTDLVQGGGFTLTNIDVNTTVDPSGATVVMDVQSGSNDLGVAANGNNNDGDTAGDIGGFDADGDGDETQNIFQVVTSVGTGNQPTSTLSTNYLGGVAMSTETTTVTDTIAPSFVEVSFHDLNGDGVLDAIAAIADEPLADSSSNGGVTIQALDGAMVQPFAGIDMTTGALPTAIELEFDMDNDIEITTFTVSRGTIDSTMTTVEALETNNAIIFSELDLSGIGSNLPGTADADVFDFAYASAMGSFEDANGNAAGDLAATNADLDRAPAVFVNGFVLNSENIPRANINDSNIQCFAETFDGGSPGSDDLGDDLGDRVAFVFSELLGSTPTTTEAGNISVDGTLLSSGGNPSATFLGDTQQAAVGNNVLTVIDDTISHETGVMPTFNIPQTADIEDAANNESIASGTLVDEQDSFLSLQQDVNSNVGWAAFLVDDDAAGEAGNGFADRILLIMTENITEAAVMGADVSDFTLSGSANTIASISLDGTNSSIIVLEIAEEGGSEDISMGNTLDITYEGDSAMNLIVGGAKESDFEAEIPAEPSTDTETPFVMAINGVLTINGSPAPVGTQICGMIAVPTVRSIVAEKNGLTFRYDREDIDEVNIDDDEGDNIVRRSLENFTDWLLGIDDSMYVICDDFNQDYFENEKFVLTRDGDGADGNEFGDTGTGVQGSIRTIDLSMNANNLSSITFTGSSDQGTVRNGRIDLCYDVLRSNGGTIRDLMETGFEIGGTPIVSKAVVTGTDGSYSLYVSLPNLEASDSNDGRSTDPNVFATQRLPVILVARTPDGIAYPLSSLVNNINGGGPIFYSAEALTQNNDGSATGSTTFNADLGMVHFHSVFEGYNIVPFASDSGFIESSNAMPTLPDGVDEDNIVVGDSLLPSAGPEDQFVWWTESDDDGAFDEGISSIVIDNNCSKGFPFILSSEGVQFGTGGVTNIVGGYAFGYGNFSGSTMGVAQFGAAITEDGLFTTNDFNNNSTTRGWATVTVTQDFANMAAFFTANPDIDYAIQFDRTGDNTVNVGSASPAGGPSSANDLTSLTAGDTLIVHYDN